MHLSMPLQTAVLGPLFMMMGRALERIATVPAGNVLAIAGVRGMERMSGSHAWITYTDPYFQGGSSHALRVEGLVPRGRL